MEVMVEVAVADPIREVPPPLSAVAAEDEASAATLGAEVAAAEEEEAAAAQTAIRSPGKVRLHGSAIQLGRVRGKLRKDVKKGVPSDGSSPGGRTDHQLTEVVTIPTQVLCVGSSGQTESDDHGGLHLNGYFVE